LAKAALWRVNWHALLHLLTLIGIMTAAPTPSQPSKTAPTPHGLSLDEISRAISFARITLIIGLVFVHFGPFPNSAASPLAGLDTQNHQFATWLNSAVRLFFYTVVPLLSMISGWLFFTFMGDPWTSIKTRMRRRAKSLYLPLVAWNAIYMIGTYALFRINPHYPLFDVLNIKYANASWLNYIDAVFGIAHRPLAFQFWFVRDLFVTAMISPLLWLMIKHIPWLGAAALCAAWLCNSHLVIFFRPDVVFFFYLGALVHQKKLSIVMPLPLVAGLVALYLLWAGLRALAPYIVVFDGDHGPLWIEVATRAMRLIGVIGWWGIMYRAAQTRAGGAIGEYGGVAFFLHAAHWPLLAIIKIELWRLLPGDSDFWMVAHYFASVALTVLIGTSLGVFLARKTPGLFAFMNGGRALARPKA